MKGTEQNHADHTRQEQDNNQRIHDAETIKDSKRCRKIQKLSSGND